MTNLFLLLSIIFGVGAMVGIVVACCICIKYWEDYENDKEDKMWPF